MVRHANPIGNPPGLDPDAQCGAKRKPRPDDDPDVEYRCELKAGFGTDHVGWGNCKYHGGNTAAHVTNAQNNLARLHVASFGLPVVTTPADALLAEVYRTAGHVAYLAQVVADLEHVDLIQYTKDKGLIWEKPAVWVEMYQAERKHLVMVCTAAIKCGIAERLVRIEESRGERLVKAFKDAMEELGVPLTSEVGQVVARHLRLITEQPAELTA